MADAAPSLAAYFDRSRGGDFEGALDAARATCEEAPKAPASHYALGEALAALGRHAEAGAAFADALRLAPGWADAGVCVRLVSEESGLRFLSVRVENYDLCFLKAIESDPRVQALIRVVRSAAYRQLLGELPGYHVAETGDLERTAPGEPK